MRSKLEAIDLMLHATVVEDVAAAAPSAIADSAANSAEGSAVEIARPPSSAKLSLARAVT